MAVMTPPSLQTATDSETTGRKGTAKSIPVGRPKGGYPAPRQLATPTDLKPEEVQKVTEICNQIVADHFALYLKYKNFHWHLSSSHFRDYHLMFDEHADELFGAIDPLAERIRKIGGTTIRSLNHIQELTGVADDDEDYVTPQAMIERLLEDNKASLKKTRDALEITDKARDYPTNDLLQELLDAAERRTWFLYEISQGAEFSG
jgi:starvation-inducible DNA-binding protein